MGWNGKHLSVKHSFDAIQLIKGPKGHFDIANLEMLLNHFTVCQIPKTDGDDLGTLIYNV